MRKSETRVGNNEQSEREKEREWTRTGQKRARAERRSLREFSLFRGIEDSIVSELRVNADNELQVRMYLRMTRQRIRRVQQ